MKTQHFAPLLAILALAACEPTTSQPTPKSPASASAAAKPDDSAELHAVEAGGDPHAATSASNAFAFAMHRQLGGDGNLAYSPASMSMALSLTYAGADGNTAREMQLALRFPDRAALHGGWASVLHSWQKATDVEIGVANRLFGDQRYTFEKPFLELTMSKYGAPLAKVDFAGAPQVQRKLINDWVAKQTRNRIDELIPAGGVSGDTRMALVNAIYFKARWASPFREAFTRAAAFRTPSGSVNVPMMTQTDRMSYAEVDGAKLAERRYAGGDFAAVFVLPDESVGLAELEKKLDALRFFKWTAALKPETVSMKLPRFQMSSQAPIELSAQLKKLGMKAAFKRGEADFTGISNPTDAAERLFIQKVYHKAFVAMNEAGTEAAAATSVMKGRSGGSALGAKAFHADRPFLFFIRHLKTGLVMFSGRVVDPKGATS